MFCISREAINNVFTCLQYVKEEPSDSEPHCHLKEILSVDIKEEHQVINIANVVGSDAIIT
mgnify:CR=1 FL=1